MALKEFLKKNKSVLLVFLLFLVIISIMQFGVNEIIGYDGWLHIKMAEIIKTQGFIKEFPYTTESILSKNYADTQLLFRILLIPFTYFGPILGAKIASVIFASLCFTFFYWYLKKNGICYPLMWTSLYALSSIDLMYRFLEARAMPLAILSILLTVYFIDKKMYKSLLVTSTLFTWLYAGFVFQLGIIAICFIINLLTSRKADLNLLLYPLAGTILALIINPYFPNNISFLYTQIFKVNLAGNLYNMEWKPWAFLELLKFNYLLFGTLITASVIALKNRKLDKKSLLFLVLSIIFLVAMLTTRRMQEYFAPFTILFAAFALNKGMSEIEEKNLMMGLSAIILIIIAIPSLIGLNTMVKNNHFLPWYRQGAEWSIKNIPNGSKVFINGYMFNYLFFYNSNLKYTHGIDLTYSYLYNPAKFNRYIETLQGIYPKYDIIKKDYNADYAIIGKVKQDIKLSEYIIKYKEDFKVVYEDDSIGILKVNK